MQPWSLGVSCSEVLCEVSGYLNVGNHAHYSLACDIVESCAILVDTIWIYAILDYNIVSSFRLKCGRPFTVH